MNQDGKEKKDGTNLPSVIFSSILIYTIIFITLMTYNKTPCISFPYRIIPQSIAFFLFVQLLFARDVNLLKLVFLLLKIDPEKIDSTKISKALYIPVKTEFIAVLFIFFIALSSFFVVAPISSFRISETPPVISRFDVTYVDTGISKLIQPGTEIDTENGVFVKAKIDGGNENTCSWFAAKGSIIPSKCQIQYTPTTGDVDVLTLTVRSTCETMETSATLCINAACLKPKP